LERDFWYTRFKKLVNFPPGTILIGPMQLLNWQMIQIAKV